MVQLIRHVFVGTGVVGFFLYAHRGLLSRRRIRLSIVSISAVKVLRRKTETCHKFTNVRIES